MREAHPRIEALGARVIAIGTGAGWQAERLMADGMPFECLVDPDANLYSALRIGRAGPLEWLKPSAIRSYVAAFRRGARQGRITGDHRRLSGVALIGPDRRLEWLHRATGVGDYPPIEQLLRVIARESD